MENTFLTHSAKETKDLGKKIGKETVPGSLLCLWGDLGAGKTTFTQGFLAGLGAEPPYTSPTFVIMKLYDLPHPTSTGVKRVYHADAYRVEEKDLRNLGFAEWCTDPEGMVILEWPERIENLLPEKRITISFKSLSETEREIILS